MLLRFLQDQAKSMTEDLFALSSESQQTQLKSAALRKQKINQFLELKEPIHKQMRNLSVKYSLLPQIQIKIPAETIQESLSKIKIDLQKISE